jgi:predicted transcriptional regulator of viral defense system
LADRQRGLITYAQLHALGFSDAAIALGDDAVLSHFAAAALWECWTGRTTPVDVTVPRRLRQQREIRVHGVHELPDTATTIHRRVPVTTPARTIIDLAGTMYSERAFRRVVHEALARELVDLSSLRARAGTRRRSDASSTLTSSHWWKRQATA